MKTLIKDEHLEQITDFFQRMVNIAMPVISWQTQSSGEKIITPVFFKQINESIVVENALKQVFTYAQGEVFFYNSSEKIIFKSPQINSSETTLEVEIPEKIIYVDQADIDSLAQSLGLEDFNEMLSSGALGEEFKQFNFISGHADDQVDNFMVDGEGRSNNNNGLETQFISGDGADPQADNYMVHGEGRANIDDGMDINMVKGSGEANITREEHMTGHTDGTDHINTHQEGETATEHLNTHQEGETSTDHIDTFKEGETSTDHIDKFKEGETSTDHIDKFKSGETSTDKIDTMTSAKTSTEKINTVTKVNSQTEKIDSAWHSKSMSKKDAALFEEELSFVTLDEEDKIFEGKRAAPRAKPPEGKMVTVQIDDASRPQSTHPLYDLSQGGIAFLVFAKEDFNPGEILHVKAFDTKKFDEPMIAEVKAVREADEMGIQYKVGCQFVTD